MIFLFWFSIILLIYTYVGYPVLLKAISFFVRQPVKKETLARICNPVTLIIAAYNEEKDIRSKIQNSLMLDYPPEKFEILVVSDGSTDRTDEIVKEYASDGVKLLRVEGRRGKTVAQNFAVEKASGEILVFSDATTIYEKDVIKRMVAPFLDQTVGCTSGRLVFKDRSDSFYSGEKNISEKYDQAIKKIESDIHSICGVNGCLYATRNELYEPLDEHLTSDFVIPLIIIEKGFRVIFEPKAVCYEEPCKNASGEFTRKIRTSRAGITGLFYMRHMLNPFRYPWVTFWLFNHKVLRWLSPFMLFSAFLLNAICFNQGPLYILFMTIQISFYVCAALGFFNEKRKKKLRLLTIPFNFLLINLAAVIGFVEFIRGNIGEAWETNRS